MLHHANSQPIKLAHQCKSQDLEEVSELDSTVESLSAPDSDCAAVTCQNGVEKNEKPLLSFLCQGYGLGHGCAW